MPDIFDQISDEEVKAAKGDIFDQIEADALQPVREISHPGFFKSFGRSLEAPLRATSGGMQLPLATDKELADHLKEQFEQSQKEGEPTTAGKVGGFAGGLIGSAAEWGLAAAATKSRTGPVAAFGAMGAYDEFLRAGLKAIQLGKTPEEAVEIGKKASVVGVAAGAGTALALPGGKVESIRQAVRHGLQAGGVTAAGQVAENIYEAQKLKLPTPWYENLPMGSGTMAALPFLSLAYGKARGWIRPTPPRPTPTPRTRPPPAPITPVPIPPADATTLPLTGLAPEAAPVASTAAPVEAAPGEAPPVRSGPAAQTIPMPEDASLVGMTADRWDTLLDWQRENVISALEGRRQAEKERERAVRPTPPPVQPEEPKPVLPSAPPIHVAPTPKHEVKEEEPPSLPVQGENPATRVADRVQQRLGAEKPLDWRELFQWADEAYGGSQSEGKYTPKDAYDAMELGVNRYIERNKTVFDPTVNTEIAKGNIRLLKEVIERLPTQSKRTGEQDEFQQFSTPPPLAYAAAWAAKLHPNDAVLEPSAGVGGLAIFGKNAGAREVVTNELSPRRKALLDTLGFTRGFGENAEQLHNILPRDVKPTVVLMNPPFSATAGRMEGVRETSIGARHIEQALKRLEPGGRLVAIVGEGMAADRPAFRDWWSQIGKEYNVRANIGMSGAEYAKYGTSFDNQMLVIDKDGPTKAPTVTGKVDKIEDLIDLLKGVRDDRPAISGSVEPTRQPVVEPSTTASEAGTGGSVSTHGVGDTATGLPGQVSGRPPGNIGEPTVVGRPIGVGAGTGEAEGTGRPASIPTRVPTGERPGERSPAPVGQPPQQVGSGAAELPPSRPVESELDVSRAAGEKAKSELTDSVYDQYKPQTIVAGAKPHPTPLSESAAMSTVLPPKVNYRPSLPKEIVTEGKLSDAQLESIVLSGHSHNQTLKTGERSGFFIGDGTGVGKGRQIAGVIFDNWNQGRKKALWLSEKSGLLKDAQRDLAGIGFDPEKAFGLHKVKLGQPIQAKDGVLFATYDTLKVKETGQKTGESGEVTDLGKRRIDQVVDWLGKDFDGVIAFDEAHNMGNAIQIKGKRGTTDPSQKALAGVELQKRLPNARVVYVSATGATEISNLSYANRLGLWGEGTPFANVSDFVHKISQGGVAAMELIARDMKGMGKYLARNLSFDGVEYERMEHTLTPEQHQIYNALAEGWQIVLQNIEEALKVTGQSADSQAKASAKAQFWGAHQRFFNQVITSMQMPTVLAKVRDSINKGRSVILQLVNTNEASQERALARAAEEGESGLQDVDMTPRDALMQFIERSFPTTEYETYFDDHGNEQSRPVLDSAGNPVRNAEAVAMRDALLDQLGSIRVPDGPLEILLNELGPDKVAEVTGRKRRVVWANDENGNRVRKVEARGRSAMEADADSFMADKKRILVFSDAGGTGRSYHSSRDAKNQTPRDHILLQPGWRADKAVQGLGRSHRSGQVTPPRYQLITTDLSAQKRFVSSIARRLDQLGALTKGSRQTGGGGFFEMRDNLESDYAKDALYQFFKDLHRGNIEGLEMAGFEKQTGLSMQDKQGNLKRELPGITQFLNRLLSLKTDMMEKVFAAFSERMDTNIQQAIEDGTLDKGLENLKGISIKPVSENIVYTHPESGAETKLVELEVTNPTKLVPWKLAEEQARTGFARNLKSGHIWAITGAVQKTAADGSIRSEYRMVSPKGSVNWVALEAVTADKFERLSAPDAQSIWEKTLAEAPKTYTENTHLLTGQLLPIWDRLPTGAQKIIRVQTDDGSRMIGRVIPDQQLKGTLQKLGVHSDARAFAPNDVFDKIMEQNATARLANDWTVKRSLVSGDQRLELIGPDIQHLAELKRNGVFTERIQFKTRFFIPTGPEGAEVLKRITENRPVVDVQTSSGWTRATEPPPTGSELAAFIPNPVTVARNLAHLVRTSHGIQSAVSAVREVGEEALKPPRMNDYRRSVLHWSAKLQRSFGEAASAQKEIMARVPDAVKREGITNWIQADGDRVVLTDRMNATVNPKLKAGYEAALKLTPEEQQLADDIKTTFNTLFTRGQSYDVVRNFKDNYVTQIWNLRKGPAMGSSRTLKERFRFSKARTFDSYFDGEQAGYVPKTKDIARLLPVYLHEMNNVVAARQLVSELAQGIAEDGRPLTSRKGIGQVVTNPAGQAVLVNPDANKPGRLKATTLRTQDEADRLNERSDYKTLENQPALTNWIWLTKDTAGNPVYEKADVSLHPEAYKRLKNVLGRSEIRQWYDTRTSAIAQIPKNLVKVIDVANSEAKRTMLGFFATFHAVQEGTHAVGHRVNPLWSIPKVDLIAEQRQMDAANHGLMLLPDRASANQFMEGFRTSGLISKIPGLGAMSDNFSQWLFHQYIPGLKFKTYDAILTRNTELFADQLRARTLKAEDVKVLSAEQANAAYGHLNYADLGRNPTIQHLLQMGLLAPDFLEARGRFAFQAIKGLPAKAGREQLVALAWLAAAQATLAWTAAQVLDADWTPKRPFELVVGNRRYSMRSVPEDIYSLLHNTRNFVTSRMSPGLNLAEEYRSQRDWRDRKVTAAETTKSIPERVLPMTLRGTIDYLFDKQKPTDLSPIEQMSGALGLRISRYNPRTELNKVHGEWMKNHPEAKVREEYERNLKSTYPESKYLALDTALADKDDVKATAALDELRGQMSDEKIERRMHQRHGNTPLYHESVRHENEFRSGLTPAQREMYQENMKLRDESYARWYRLWQNRNK